MGSGSPCGMAHQTPRPAKEAAAKARAPAVQAKAGASAPAW